MGEIPLVCGVGLVGLGGELVGPGGADIADELLEVVLVFNEPPRELIEQLGIHGRVCDADIVHIVDQPRPKEVRPDDVDEVAGKILVVRRRQPGGHHFAAVPAREVGLLAPQKLWRHDSATDRMLDVTAPRIEDDRLAAVLPRLAANLGEEVGEAVIVLHGPAVEGMVVALGALNPHPQKHLRDVLRHFQRVELVLVVVGGRA